MGSSSKWRRDHLTLGDSFVFSQSQVAFFVCVRKWLDHRWPFWTIVCPYLRTTRSKPSNIQAFKALFGYFCLVPSFYKYYRSVERFGWERSASQSCVAENENRLNSTLDSNGTIPAGVLAWTVFMFRRLLQVSSHLYSASLRTATSLLPGRREEVSLFFCPELTLNTLGSISVSRRAVLKSQRSEALVREQKTSYLPAPLSFLSRLRSIFDGFSRVWTLESHSYETEQSGAGRFPGISIKMLFVA